MSFVFFIVNYTASYIVSIYMPKDVCAQVHTHSIHNKKKKDTQDTYFL